MNRRRKLLGAVCVLLTGVTFLCAPWQADQKSQVERQFHADLEELTQTAELVLAGAGGGGAFRLAECEPV